MKNLTTLAGMLVLVGTVLSVSDRGAMHISLDMHDASTKNGGIAAGMTDSKYEANKKTTSVHPDAEGRTGYNHP